MKIRPVGADLLHADRQTDTQTEGQRYRQADMMQPIVTLRNFANATNSCVYYRQCSVLSYTTSGSLVFMSGNLPFYVR
jgi:hypothetical protein